MLVSTERKGVKEGRGKECCDACEGAGGMDFFVREVVGRLGRCLGAPNPQKMDRKQWTKTGWSVRDHMNASGCPVPAPEMAEVSTSKQTKAVRPFPFAHLARA